MPGGQRIPLRVNGQAIDSDQPYEVLPGRYEVTTGLPFIDYSGAQQQPDQTFAREQCH